VNFFVEKEFTEESLNNFNVELLSAENLKHIKALRLKTGEQLALTNLKGEAWCFSLQSSSPLLLSFERKILAEEPKVKSTLVLSPPIGEALEQAIIQATEVGYDEIVFFRSQHCQQPKEKELPLSRLRRLVEASCKQSGRLRAPLILEEFFSFDKVLSFTQDACCVVADETKATKSWGSQTPIVCDKNKVAIFIGPEGGWSQEERQLLSSHCVPISLGPHILRVPTAVATAYVLAWKDLKV
jgi:16S rRNA (uracil1498-N3)-methyltransferase